MSGPVKVHKHRLRLVDERPINILTYVATTSRTNSIVVATIKNTSTMVTTTTDNMMRVVDFISQMDCRRDYNCERLCFSLVPWLIIWKWNGRSLVVLSDYITFPSSLPGVRCPLSICFGITSIVFEIFERQSDGCVNEWIESINQEWIIESINPSGGNDIIFAKKTKYIFLCRAARLKSIRDQPTSYWTV